MKKLYLLATLVIVSSTIYGANYGANENNNKTNNNSSTGDQRANQSRLFADNDTRFANNDQKLAKDIRDKLSSGIFNKGYEQVSVDVRNGNVTLSGSVQTPSDKNKVEKEIRNLQGVRSLNSRISVVDKGTSMNTETSHAQDSYAKSTDQQLNMKIRDKITGWFWDSYPEVSINTTDGIVVLEGMVDSPKDQQSLMVEVRKIEGVKGVKSNLKVKNNNNQ